MTFDTSEPLDDLDWHITEVLQEDGRVSFAELGRRVGLSPPAVAERVRGLEEAGVITGYRAVVDPSRLGLPIQAIVRTLTQANGPACRSQQGQILDVPEVLEAWRVSGSDTLVMRVAARSIAHLDDLLSRLLDIGGQTVTTIVLTTPVPHRPISRAVAEGPSGQPGASRLAPHMPRSLSSR